jgi:hypothetical protein
MFNFRNNRCLKHDWFILASLFTWNHMYFLTGELREGKNVWIITNLEQFTELTINFAATFTFECIWQQLNDRWSMCWTKSIGNVKVTHQKLTRQAMYKQTQHFTALSFNNFRGKVISITYEYSECVPITLDIQHANHMRPAIFMYVACLAVLFFLPHYLIAARLCGKVTECKVHVWIFCTTFSKTFLILRRI